jgi:hypothetical protein
LIATDTLQGAVIASGCSQTWNGARAVDTLDTFFINSKRLSRKDLKQLQRASMKSAILSDEAAVADFDG